MKRKLMLMAVIIGIVSILSAGTLAFFTAEEKATNVITSGNVEILLEEWTDQVDEVGNPVPYKEVYGVMPGTSVSKIVQVKNTGGADAYIRIKTDVALALEEEVNWDADAGLISMDFNTLEWTQKEGYYYYNVALKPGDTTEPLFSKVTFGKDMGNHYQNSTAIIEVKAYAVQKANNGATVFEAVGWAEDSILDN